mgnify:CR=1 FL=1
MLLGNPFQSVYPSASQATSARHGSAEHGSDPRRARSRDNQRTRDSRGRSVNERDLPQVTLGPQNTIDLGQQFASPGVQAKYSPIIVFPSPL